MSVRVPVLVPVCVCLQKKRGRRYVSYLESALMLLKRGSSVLHLFLSGSLMNSLDTFSCIVVSCGMGEAVNVNQTYACFFSLDQCI